MKVIVALLALGSITFTTYAQNFDLNQDWQTEEDFRAVEKTVMDNILWLEENPLATDLNNTKAISEYVLKWLTNCPYVSVTYDEIFLEGLRNTKKYKFGEKFRITYLFGKSYYILSNKSDADEAKASVRGIEGMVKVYIELKKVDPSVKIKELEKFSRLVKSNQIEPYVVNQLEKIKGQPL